MKVRDVEKICASPVAFLERKDFSKYVELPCLESCLYLYDLNIQIFSSSCNKINSNEANIMIYYNSLSEENKIIANTLVNNGLAKKSVFKNQEFITIVIKTNLDDDINDVNYRLKSVASSFQFQDILYGFISKEQFIKQYVESKKEFKYNNGELIPINRGHFINEEELENRKRNILFDVNEVLENAIDDGIVDLYNNVVWQNTELFQKHISYVENLKGMGNK